MKRVLPLMMALAAGACDLFGFLGPGVVSITASPSEVLMTAGGSMVSQISVELNSSLDETVHFAVTTSGPVQAGPVVTAGQGSWRTLAYRMTAAGSASIVVKAGLKADTISITAVPLSLKTVSQSFGYGCGIATDDRTWCWGGNMSGQLGVPTVGDCNGAACQYGGNSGNSTPLPLPADRHFVSINTSGFTCTGYSGFVTGNCGETCALTELGKMWCWGDVAGPATAMAPELTFASLTGRPSTSIFGGGSVACGLTTAGKAWCFQMTWAGQGFAVGPKELMPDMTFKALSVGRYHTCGVDLAGDAWCWGDNSRGSLGTGDTRNSDSPVKVSTTSKFTAIDVGDYSTCALDSGGILQCWGTGYSASGSGTPASCSGYACQTTPLPVSGGRTYSSFSRGDGGGDTLCGLATDGSVDCWSAYNLQPDPVPLPERAISVTVGDHPCAITITNVLYCWTGKASAIAKFGQQGCEMSSRPRAEGTCKGPWRVRRAQQGRRSDLCHVSSHEIRLCRPLVNAMNCRLSHW